MPNRPKHPCGAPNCPELVDGRYCEKHRGANYREQDSIRGNSAARGYGAAWRKRRAQVLREEPLCRECLAIGRTTAANEVDHVIAKSKGGTDDRANLQALCKSHHSAKTMKESVGGNQ